MKSRQPYDPVSFRRGPANQQPARRGTTRARKETKFRRSGRLSPRRRSLIVGRVLRLSDAASGELVGAQNASPIPPKGSPDRCEQHIVGSTFGKLRLEAVTAGKVDLFLSEKEDGLSARSVNHLRE